MSRPTYSDVYDTIALYANEVLPLFADMWERFPQGQCAKMLVTALRVQQESWNRRRPEGEQVQKLTAAIDEIERRASEH